MKTLLILLSIWSIVITTDNNLEPTGEAAIHPDGCIGHGITNKTTVTGQLYLLNENGDTLYNSHEFVEDVSGIKLKLRGNNPAVKNYKVKLQKKADLLHRGDDNTYKDKEWGMKRCTDGEWVASNTAIATIVAEAVSQSWATQYKIVNLTLNGRNRGRYVLSEVVNRNTKCRINVNSTGFLTELDPYWWNESVSVETYIFAYYTCPLKYTFQYPDDKDITEEQMTYWQEVIQTFESSIGTNYEDYIDVDSWARWLLAHEILGDSDPPGSNIFVTKYDNTPNSKIKLGPIWDFETIEYADTTAHVPVYYQYYFHQLINSANPTFKNTMYSIYRQEEERIWDEIFQGVESLRAEGDISEQEIARHEKWLIKRREWLKEEMKETTAIPQQTTQEANRSTYDIFGRKISNNTYLPQGIYISNKRKKVIVH